MERKFVNKKRQVPKHGFAFYNLAAAVLQLNSGKIKLSNKGDSLHKRMKNFPLDKGKCLLFDIINIRSIPKMTMK
jgi:hypothetical protein